MVIDKSADIAVRSGVDIDRESRKRIRGRVQKLVFIDRVVALDENEFLVLKMEL